MTIEVACRVDTLASLLAKDSEKIGRELLRRVAAEMPDLVADDHSRDVAQAVIEANLESFAVALERGLTAEEIEAPWLSIQLARHHAWNGIGLDRALRIYRLGQEWLWEQLVVCSRDHTRDREGMATAVAEIGALSFRYADVVCKRVADEYKAESQAIADSMVEKRTRIVDALVDGDCADLTDAERTLGYRLDGCHLAFVLFAANRGAGDPAPPLETVARSMSSSLNCRHPLLLPEGPDVMVAWVSIPDSNGIPWDAIANSLAGTTITVAVGEPRSGIAGFGETRRLAERTRAVAMTIGASGQLLRHDDVALLSLLIADAASARAFVAAELRELAGDDDTCRTLRRTLLVLLRCGGSPLEAAEALFVHRNTVAHRVRKAEELLGRPVQSRRQEIEAALLICESLDRFGSQK